MKEIEVAKMTNDDLKREYINHVIGNKLRGADDITEERTKILYNEVKKRHLLASVYRKIKDMRL